MALPRQSKLNRFPSVFSRFERYIHWCQQMSALERIALGGEAFGTHDKTQKRPDIPSSKSIPADAMRYVTPKKYLLGGGIDGTENLPSENAARTFYRRSNLHLNTRGKLQQTPNVKDARNIAFVGVHSKTIAGSWECGQCAMQSIGNFCHNCGVRCLVLERQ